MENNINTDGITMEKLSELKGLYDLCDPSKTNSVKIQHMKASITCKLIKYV
jgi:hypothetical protein